MTAVARALEPLREPFAALSGLQTEEVRGDECGKQIRRAGSLPLVVRAPPKRTRKQLTDEAKNWSRGMTLESGEEFILFHGARAVELALK